MVFLSAVILFTNSECTKNIYYFTEKMTNFHQRFEKSCIQQLAMTDSRLLWCFYCISDITCVKGWMNEK